MASLCVAAGLVAGRALGRAVRRRNGGTTPREVGDKPGEVADAGDALEGFPCHLGDVVLAHPGEEAWLAGALLFREKLPMAALFIAPDAGGGRAIYARPAPDAMFVWLTPLPAGALAIGSEPPSSIEHQRERFERTRRLPYRVERLGTGAPDVGETVVVAEYGAAGGDWIVVVVGGGTARGWRGRRLEEGMYDVLPGGKGTLAEG